MPLTLVGQQAEQRDIRKGNDAGAAAEQKDITRDEKTLNSGETDVTRERKDVPHDRRPDMPEDRNDEREIRAEKKRAAKKSPPVLLRRYVMPFT